MRRAAILAALVIVSLLLGAGSVLLVFHHPFVTSINLGTDTADARASIASCKLYGTWPVELKPGEHLILERRICPLGFHKSEDDEGWPSGAQHEVLLLEKRTWWSTKIVSALFSDLDFTQVEVGKTEEGLDAVLWAYNVKCGSCHGGPYGLLSYSQASNAYDWHEDWIDDPSIQALIAKNIAADERLDDAPALTWGFDRKTVNWQESIYGDADANCCPSDGEFYAAFVVRQGLLVPTDGSRSKRAEQ